MIKLSIVVPVYNVEKYLARCLDTLLGQTLNGIEIIAVNDGSTDNSRNILLEYSKNHEERFRFYDKENGGLSDARNFALPFCKGEYVGFVDSDDYVELDMYEKMFTLAKRENADVVVCDYFIEYPKHRKIMRVEPATKKEEILCTMLAAAWNKIYRLEWLNGTGVIFPKGLVYEDTEFFSKLIPSINRISYLRQPMVHYVQRSGSIANTQSEDKIKQMFMIMNNIHLFYSDRVMQNSLVEAKNCMCVRVLLGSSMERICRISNHKVRNELILETLDYLDTNIPNWKQNRFIRSMPGLRKYYLLFFSKKTGKVLSIILARFFEYKNKRLFS